MSIKKSTPKGGFRNTLETGKEFLADASTSVTSGFPEDFFGQILGINFEKKSQKGIDPLSLPEAEAFDPTKGEIVDFTKLKQLEIRTSQASDHARKSEQHARTSERITPGLDYRRELLGERRISKLELREINTRVDDIMSELRKLISSSKILQIQFADVTIEQPPAEVGTYHVNFFEWLLSVIKVARQRVEDSSMWLSTINAKSNKKKGYWGMFKKHGTTFGLSHERSLATQTG